MENNTTQQLDKIGKETLLALLTTKTKTAAAEALSIERSTLYDRIEKYHLNSFMQKLPAQALQTLQLGSERAAEVLVAMLDTGNVDKKFVAAKEILDRVGLYTPKERSKMLMAMDIPDTMKIEFVVDS